MTPYDELARELHYLKTTTPRVEGCYGIIITEESETIESLCKHIEQLPSNERVLHLNLSTSPTTLKLRQLINALLEEDTGRQGIPSLTIRLKRLKKHHANSYTIAIIEHAQRLNIETFSWLVSNMRTIIDLFILVFPNENAFDQLVRRSRLDRGWTFGRGTYFHEAIELTQQLDEATK